MNLESSNHLPVFGFVVPVCHAQPVAGTHSAPPKLEFFCSILNLRSSLLPTRTYDSIIHILFNTVAAELSTRSTVL
jgi:hypothetical protein